MALGGDQRRPQGELEVERLLGVGGGLGERGEQPQPLREVANGLPVRIPLQRVCCRLLEMADRQGGVLPARKVHGEELPRARRLGRHSRRFPGSDQPVHRARCPAPSR